MLFPLVRRRWAKVLVVMYPIATVFCIIVTANHYWLDAAVGMATLGLGYVIGCQVADFWDRRHRAVAPAI